MEGTWGQHGNQMETAEPSAPKADSDCTCFWRIHASQERKRCPFQPRVTVSASQRRQQGTKATSALHGRCPPHGTSTLMGGVPPHGTSTLTSTTQAHPLPPPGPRQGAGLSPCVPTKWAAPHGDPAASADAANSAPWPRGTWLNTAAGSLPDPVVCGVETGECLLHGLREKEFMCATRGNDGRHTGSSRCCSRTQPPPVPSHPRVTPQRPWEPRPRAGVRAAAPPSTGLRSGPSH